MARGWLPPVYGSRSRLFILIQGFFTTPQGLDRYRRRVPRPVPPPAASLHHLHSRDSSGALFAGGALLLTIAGFWLSLRASRWPWLAGQAVLGIAFVQWFALLHECGHFTLFRRRRLNSLAGHAAGLCALIPFGMWTYIHRQHHKWTGWQDLDPTTATLTPQPRGALQRTLVRIAWRLWLPLFSSVYRLTNFWNPGRMARGLRSGELRWPAVAEGLTCLALYAFAVWQIGALTTLRLVGLALLIAFVIEDVLILSQHTHVPMELSHGRPVLPHRALAQERYTRSLRLPAPASWLLLHFDAHELHHMYPFVPGYDLRRIDYEPENEVGWWAWLRGARALPGDVLLFQNRHDTGFDL